MLAECGNMLVCVSQRLSLASVHCERVPVCDPQSGSSSMVGVTSLALSPWDPDTFLVGSEGGLLLRCAFSSQTLAASPSQGHSVPLRAPAVFSFKPHSGPVHSIHFSPFHRSLLSPPHAAHKGLIKKECLSHQLRIHSDVFVSVIDHLIDDDQATSLHMPTLIGEAQRYPMTCSCSVRFSGLIQMVG